MADRLTRAEVIVLRLVGEELSNKDIARRLGRSLNTVQNHLTSAYAKLGTSDRREAAFLVARDYPYLSQFPPMAMAADPGSPSAVEARGDEGLGDREIETDGWMLPEPPKRLLRILSAVLGFAALSGLVTGGLVLLARGGLETLAPAAPPDAVLALDPSNPSRTP